MALLSTGTPRWLQTDVVIDAGNLSVLWVSAAGQTWMTGLPSALAVQRWTPHRWRALRIRKRSLKILKRVSFLSGKTDRFANRFPTTRVCYFDSDGVASLICATWVPLPNTLVKRNILNHWMAAWGCGILTVEVASPELLSFVGRQRL